MSLIQIAVLGVVGVVVLAFLLFFWMDLWKTRKDLDRIQQAERKTERKTERMTERTSERKAGPIDHRKVKRRPKDEPKKNRLRVIK